MAHNLPQQDAWQNLPDSPWETWNSRQSSAGVDNLALLFLGWSLELSTLHIVLGNTRADAHQRSESHEQPMAPPPDEPHPDDQSRGPQPHPLWTAPDDVPEELMPWAPTIQLPPDPESFLQAPDSWLVSQSGDPTPDTIGSLGNSSGTDRSVGQAGPRAQQPFQLLHRLGETDTAEVWEGVQTSLDRTVVIRRLKEPTAEDSQLRTSEIFYREAVLTGGLDHPTVVPVYDLEIDDQNRPQVAMKLVRGQAWSSVIAEDRATLHPSEFLARHIPILADVAQAISYVHSRGIIHRDLKPAEIMVGRYGEVFVMNWGLATAIPGGAGEAVNPAGTPWYMAPEQTDTVTERLGPWTDVYLLGAILYELLTGRAPHDVGDSASCARHAESDATPDLLTALEPPAAPPELAVMALAALAYDPQARPSADAFLHSLQDYVSGRDRSRQSQELLEEAESQLRHITADDLASWAAVETLLARAVAIWPRNETAVKLLQNVIAQSAEAALTVGDLGLARAQAMRLPGNRGVSLQQRIDQAFSRRRTRAWQRRIAQAAAAILLIAVSALAIAYYRNVGAEAVTRELHLRQMAALTQQQMFAKRAAAEASQLAEQSLAVATLTTSETLLANDLLQYWNADKAIPPRLTATAYEAQRWRQVPSAVRIAFEQRFQDLRDERKRLTNTGLSLPPPNSDLLFAMATHYLAKAANQPGDSASILLAHDLYQEMVPATLGVTVRPVVGQACAAFRLGRFPEALTLLHTATAEVRRRAGLRRDAQRIVTLALEVQRLAFQKFHTAPDDILLQSRWKAPTQGTYADTGIGWTNSNTPAEWAQSIASSSLTSSSVGSRKLVLPSNGGTTESRTARASFQLAIHEPETYHVYATWPLGASAAPVSVTVRHSTGTARLQITQDGWGSTGPSNANVWINLGTFGFLPGANQGVDFEITSRTQTMELGFDGQVMADAVLFTKAPLPSDLVRSPADTASTPRSVQWFLSETNALAAAQGRPIFTFFDEAIDPTRIMADRVVFNNLEVVQLLNNAYVPLRMDPSPTAADFERYGRRMPGTAMISTTSGTVLRVIQGADLLDPERLSRILRDTAR